MTKGRFTMPQFDHYDGNLILTEDEIAAAAQHVPQGRDDIAVAHDNVRRFTRSSNALNRRR